jgi:DNA polymerase-4
MGITRIGQLQALDDSTARRRLGEDGPSLVRRARGEDARRVEPERETKSVSAETTFNTDLSNPAELERVLWRMAERVAARLRAGEWAAGGVVLKLKTAKHVIRTRTQRLAAPTALADVLFATARAMLTPEADGTAFRLIGLGAQPLRSITEADPADLADPDSGRRVARQQALDHLRDRFGPAIIGRGRGFG